MLRKVKNYIGYKLKLLSIKIIPWFIAKKYTTEKGNFLFIDCGSNIGQGYNHFKKYFTPERFDYVLIEPNSSCVKILNEKYGKDLDIIEKGVWTSETKLNLFGIEETGEKLSQGGSLLKNHNSSFYKTKTDTAISPVNTINFSKFLEEKKKEYDTIIVKMDIESSEYVVLPFIIEDGSINLIDHIFIEFHSEFFDSNEKSKYEDIEKKIIKDLKHRKIGFTRWI